MVVVVAGSRVGCDEDFGEGIVDAAEGTQLLFALFGGGESVGAPDLPSDGRKWLKTFLKNAYCRSFMKWDRGEGAEKAAWVRVACNLKEGGHALGHYLVTRWVGVGEQVVGLVPYALPLY